MPVPDAPAQRRLLERMLGLRACVRKRREVWLYKHARIHLDTVERLGRFIEIEVVVTDGMARARALMKETDGGPRIDGAARSPEATTTCASGLEDDHADTRRGDPDTRLDPACGRIAAGAWRSRVSRLRGARL